MLDLATPHIAELCLLKKAAGSRKKVFIWGVGFAHNPHKPFSFLHFDFFQCSQRRQVNYEVVSSSGASGGGTSTSEASSGVGATSVSGT